MTKTSGTSGAALQAPTAPEAGRGSAEPADTWWDGRGARAVDAALISFAMLWWGGTLVAYAVGLYPYVPAWLVPLDLVLSALGCLALWWRRSHPLEVAVLLCVVQSVSNAAAFALFAALVGLTARCPWRQVISVAAATAVLVLPWTLLLSPTMADKLLTLVTVYAVLAASLGWGAAARARRELVERLRADVRREVEERELRLAAARADERRRIAREMHDVVAHRLSLVSVHAAGLAYRTEGAEQGRAAPLESAELTEAVGVIRDNTHRALEELSAVLSVLNAADTAPADGEDRTGTAAPQAQNLAGLARLAEEARGAGQRVEDTFHVPDDTDPPGQVCRTAYRVVQEGLTNTRKHAPGARVDVRISGAPGRGLEVSVCNPLSVGVAGIEIPGAGAGLTGLAERVALDGGSLVHGPADGYFRLRAELPWPHAAEPS